MANVSMSDSLYTLTSTLVSLEFAAGDSEFKKDTRSGVNPFKLIDAAADLHVEHSSSETAAPGKARSKGFR